MLIVKIIKDIKEVLYLVLVIKSNDKLNDKILIT